MAKKARIPHKFLPWIHVREKFRLSDAHVQMARELGLSPKRFDSYADRSKETWKLPLKEFIEAQYQRQFKKERPDVVKTMEEIAAEHVARRAARKAENARRDEALEAEANVDAGDSMSETAEASEETAVETEEIADPAAPDESQS